MFIFNRCSLLLLAVVELVRRFSSLLCARFTLRFDHHQLCLLAWKTEKPAKDCLGRFLRFCCCCCCVAVEISIFIFSVVSYLPFSVASRLCCDVHSSLVIFIFLVNLTFDRLDHLHPFLPIEIIFVFPFPLCTPLLAGCRCCWWMRRDTNHRNFVASRKYIHYSD